jgi:hypothetical protein
MMELQECRLPSKWPNILRACWVCGVAAAFRAQVNEPPAARRVAGLGINCGRRHMRTTTLKWEVAATAGGSRVEARRKRGGEMGWDAGRWCPAGFSLRGGVMGFRLEQ